MLGTKKIHTITVAPLLSRSVSGKTKAHKHKLFVPVALGTTPGLSQGQTRLVLGQTHFGPGTSPEQSWGRRAAEKVYVLKVDVPFSLKKLCCIPCGKTREKGTHYRSGKKSIHNRGLKDRKRKRRVSTVAGVYPDPPILVFFDFLGFFRFPISLVFFCVFLFFSKDFMGSAKRKTLAFF